MSLFNHFRGTALIGALLLGAAQAQPVVNALFIAPSQTVFTVTADQATKANQTLDVEPAIGLGNLPFEFSFAQVTQQNVPNFIVLTPSTGVAPSLAKLSLNPAVIAGMPPGSYDLSYGIRSTDAAHSVRGGAFVHLLLLPPAAPPSISAVVHSATQQPILSPGELITIYGTGFNIAPFSAQSIYPTTLSNTRVTVNGIPAPLLYVSPTQINAVVPYEITLLEAQQATQPTITAPVVVTYDFMPSTAFNVQVLPSAPGIFTVAPNGKGQGAIQNVDPQTGALTVNSAANPASKGSTIVIYATGVGIWNQTSADGAVITDVLDPPYYYPGAASLTIGGQPATLLYAGAAPNMVSGMLQVNAIVPDGVGSGAQTVILTTGGSDNSGQGVTIAIR